MAPPRFQPKRVAVAAAAALAVCVVGPAGYAAPASVTSATDAQPIDPARAAAPMQAVFGAAWRADDGAALIHIDEGADVGWWHMTPLAWKRLPNRRTLLIVNGAPHGKDGSSSPAGADGGMLNLYVLRQTQSAWQVLERHEDVAKMGSLGMIGTVRWLDLGAGRQGIVISSGEAAVGSRVGVADIYELDRGLRHLGRFADIGLDELWCHQLDRMALALQLACPIMRTSTCFHADETGRQIDEEDSHLIALDLLHQHRVTLGIDSVNLKHALCQIDANCRNLHGGRLPRFSGCSTLPLWHI